MQGIEDIIIIEDKSEELNMSPELEEELNVSEEIEEEIILVEDDDVESIILEDFDDDSVISVEEDAIVLGVSLQKKQVDPQTYRQEVVPDFGYNGMDLVVVNAVNPSDYYKEEESIVVNPNITSQEIYPSENKVINKVSVNAVDKNIDPNIKSENIKKGITILDVTGTLETDKPDQTKTIKPTTEVQRVLPDSGYELSEVVVDAVNPSDYYKEEVVLEVNPTENTQIITPPNGKVANQVNVDAIPNNYVGSAIQRSEGFNVEPTTDEMLVVGANTFVTGDIKVNAVNPADYYKEEVEIDVTPTESVQVINPPNGKVINLVNVGAIDSNYVGSDVDRVNGFEIEPTTSEQVVVNANTFVTGDVVVSAVNPSDYYKEEERVVVTPTTSEQTILPSEDKAIGEVFVNAVKPSDYYKPEVTGRFKSSLSEVTYSPATGSVYKQVTIEPMALQSKVVHNNGTITPDVGYDGLSEVRVNVPQPAPVLIEKTITENGRYVSTDDSADGYSVVNVDVPTSTPELVEKTITANGTYSASDDSADGYSVVKVNVKGGASARVDGKYLCRIYDYDGSLVQPDQWLNEGDVFALPELPTHDLLIAQGWNSPITITDNQIVVENQDVIISVVYATKSGMTEIDIELTPVTGLELPFKMSGTKDWGDGTSDTASGHTYKAYGKYTIKCNGTISSMTASSRLFGQSNSNINYSCVAVRIGNNVTTTQNYTFGYCYSLKYCTMPMTTKTVGGYAFEFCYGLNTVSMPSQAGTIGAYAFRYCSSLVDVAIPPNITSLAQNVFQYCFSLKYLTLHSKLRTFATYCLQGTIITRAVVAEGASGISNYAFSGCVSLQEVIMPSTMRTLSPYSFYDCTSLVKFDLSKVTTGVSLGGTTVFTNINKICKIIVPDSLYDEMLTATNWSTYADYLYKASEVIE